MFVPCSRAALRLPALRAPAHSAAAAAAAAAPPRMAGPAYPAPPAVEFLQPEALAALLRAPASRATLLILDVRDDDFAGGNIRGAVNIPSYDLDGAALEAFFEARCGPASGVKTVVVHCYLSQQRGPTAARRLAAALAARGRAGAPAVAVLAHGWRRFGRMFAGDAELVENVG
jgi:rhodanese-related sulfurtransferase